MMFVKDENHIIGGFGRSIAFPNLQRFGAQGKLASRVLFEPGTASGREPTADVLGWYKD